MSDIPALNRTAPHAGRQETACYRGCDDVNSLTPTHFDYPCDIDVILSRRVTCSNVSLFWPVAQVSLRWRPVVRRLSQFGQSILNRRSTNTVVRPGAVNAHRARRVAPTARWAQRPTRHRRVRVRAVRPDMARLPTVRFAYQSRIATKAITMDAHRAHPTTQHGADHQHLSWAALELSRSRPC